MSTYTSTYADVYGGPPFPESPLDVAVELDLAGDWTDVTTYALQRDGTSPPITIQRGRPSETSQATPSSAAWQFNNRDGRFSPRCPTGPYYGELAVRNNPVRISVPDSGVYLRFADDFTSYAAGPSTGLVEITGNIDIRVDMWLDSYAPCVLASRWSSATDAGDWSWAFVLNSDGTLSFVWYDGDAVSTATSTQPIPYLGRIMVRAVFLPGDLDDPTVTFWTAPDMAGSYAQLGAAVPINAEDAAEDAPGVPVTVGYSAYAGYVTASGTPPWQFPGGCVGKIYELQLWGNGTLVTDAQFYSQPAGTTSFTDTTGNTWTLAGSATLTARSFRCHLECSSLPQQWDETGTDVWTPVGASGILRRLQQGNSPIWSAMRRAVASGETGQVATCFWPAEDFQGSQNIASGLPGGSPMLFSGAPQFQGTAGSLSADSLFACSAQLAQIGTSVWYGSIPAYTPGANTEQLTFLLALPSGGITSSAILARISMAGGHTIDLVASTGSGGSLDVNVDGSLSFDGPTGLNGVPVLVQLGPGGFADTCELFVLPLGTGAVSSGFSGVSDTGTTWTRVAINPGAANFGATECGQIWFTPAGTGLTGLSGPLNAWTGETAAFRFARICGENSITPRIYGFPGLSAIMGPQEIDTLSNVLQSAEDADRGQMYEPAETLGLGYRTLHSLCAQDPAITLDYTLGLFGGDGSQGLVPTDDDQFTVNDVTLSRNNGSSYQYQVTEGPMSVQEPPDGAGDYATSLTVYVAYDTQLPQIASWMAAVGTCDEERYPSVPMNLARPQLASLTYAIQDVRIGDYVQILNPPAWLPPGDIDQLCYGVTEKLGGFFWSIAWNAVPEAPYEVAIAGTDAADSAHADTAGSELAEAYDATATSLSVETTEGPIWTTDGGSGSGQQAIVPLYSYPPSGFWTDVTANPGPMAMIICNVDSGPGTGYESNFGAVFEAAAAAGITCLGYVPTGYGADTIASIEAQVDLWETYYGIVSIMFDTVSPYDTYLSHYEELVDYVHGRGGICVLNPGEIPAEGYMSIGADVVQVCEDSYANFATDAGMAPSWLFDYPATSISVTCNQCSTEGDMVTVVGLAASAFNAHFCWVTADGIYEAEPSYFAAEVTELGYAPGGGGDFPFDVQIGGEQITVTDITGGTSPQTFTVIRSVNGIVKAQGAGTAVALFHPPILALA